MSHVDSGPKNDSDSEQKTEPARDSSSGEMVVPKTKLLDAKAILWTFGKCLTAMLPVYLAGYYRMSTSLVMFGMMVYAGWKHSREAKEARLRSAIQLLNDEQEYISSKSFRSRGDLPSWVNFPDVEKVEWLNKVIHQAWPYIGQYLEKLLTETIASSIRGSSTHLQTLSFTKIDFGGKPMKVVGVKAHSENEKGQILLDVYISYVGDVEINVEVKRYFCKAGVKGIQLHGMMRVILEPLIGDVPIVGAVTMFFIQRPKLTINWTGLTNLLDIPGVNMMSDTMIMDAIASFLVLPNRLTVPLVADLHVAQLRSPLPRGVVRIHLVEAESLAAKDTIVSGVSDPYALLRVGPQTFKSQHLDNTLNPKWGEMYEVIVHEVPGQELEVEVFDKDPDQDDFLGRTKLDLGIVKKSKIVDEWFTLKDTPTGRVHLRLEWLTLEADTGRLTEVLKRNESVVSKTAKPPSAAIMALYLDKAEALPDYQGTLGTYPEGDMLPAAYRREDLRIHIWPHRNAYGTLEYQPQSGEWSGEQAKTPERIQNWPKRVRERIPAQFADYRIWRRCWVSPSLQLCRCLLARRRALKPKRRLHSEWNGPSHQGGTEGLAAGKTKQWHPLSSGTAVALREPFPSGSPHDRQRAGLRCGEHVPDRAVPRLGLPPPGQRLQVHHQVPEGSGRNLGHISRPGSQEYVRVSRPELQAHFVNRECVQVPYSPDGYQCNQECCHIGQGKNSTDCKGSRGGLCRAPRSTERSPEGRRGGRRI
ncbi:extended synaptotagmin-2 [Pimephales promelas]|nr:extended synaptotagmin-2 [Pimephales promelas]